MQPDPIHPDRSGSQRVGFHSVRVLELCNLEQFGGSGGQVCNAMGLV